MVQTKNSLNVILLMERGETKRRINTKQQIRLPAVCFSTPTELLEVQIKNEPRWFERHLMQTNRVHFLI